MSDLPEKASDIEPHKPVNVTREMGEKAEPAPERWSRPSNGAAVRRIVKRESVPAEDAG